MSKDILDEHTEVLNEIRLVSKRLNQASDAATDKIDSVEKRLVDADPGVTVWGPELVDERIDHLDEESGASRPAKRTVTLGFGRSKKKWGFVVREEIKGQRGSSPDDFSLSILDEVRALRKADRDIRIMALPHLASVVHAVRDELNERTSKLWKMRNADNSGAGLEIGATSTASV